MAKRIKVTLTDAAPINIDPEVWGVIARADWHDGQVESQAFRTRRITVREHDDGRCLVYGWSTSAWAGEQTYDVGYLLEAYDLAERMERIIATIRRVASEIGDEDLAARCIADLPAVDLD